MQKDSSSKQTDFSKFQYWLEQHQVNSLEKIIYIWDEVQFDKIWNTFPEIYTKIHKKYAERRERNRELWRRFFRCLMMLVLVIIVFTLVYQNRYRKIGTDDISQQEIYKKLSQKSLTNEKETSRKSLQILHPSTLLSLQNLYTQVDNILDLSITDNKWYVIGERLIHIQILPGAGMRFLDLKSRKTYHLNEWSLSQHRTKINSVRFALKQFIKELYSTPSFTNEQQQ